MATVRYPRLVSGRCLAVPSSSTITYLVYQNRTCYPDEKIAITGDAANGTLTPASTWDTTITALGSTVVLHNTWSPYVTTIASGSIPYATLDSALHALVVDVDAAYTAGLFSTSFSVAISTAVSSIAGCTAVDNYIGWYGGGLAGYVVGIGTVVNRTVYADGHWT